MARGKYSGDYRLTDSLDDRGRIRTETEYVGGDYRFVRKPGEVGAALKRLSILSAAAWLCFLLPLLPRSTAGRTMWVMLPWVFTLLPLWRLSSALLRLRGAGETLRHREADLANERPSACGGAMTVLAGIALVGEAVALFLPGAVFYPGDALFLLCALLLAGCGLLCRRRAEDLRTREL